MSPKAASILEELAALGSEQIKKIFLRHGAREPFFGVKVGDLQKIVKREKKNHALALELYATGNSDAMYLAGLLADEKKVTVDELQRWVREAYWYMISEHTVPWVAADSQHGLSLALQWIESDQENIAAAGWSTLSSLAGVRPDAELDLPLWHGLLDRVAATLHRAPNRVRHTMNGFVIAAGSFVPPLTEHALQVAHSLGVVHVDMGGTSCKVPAAAEYIEKAKTSGRWGRKKKMARC